MKILVTGASGFIGSFLCEEGLRRGMETWAGMRERSSKRWLTTREMRVAILTRLNFSPNELAILLETSSQRITNLKEKVNRKLFQDESAKTL